ncbi:MAG: hypothetical protein AAFZ65_08840, partial [Planctomycetota bacterium]
MALALLAQTPAWATASEQGAAPGHQSPFGAFVENVGQWPEHVLFMRRFGGLEVRVDTDAVWVMARVADGDGATGLDVTRFAIAGTAEFISRGEASLGERWHFLPEDRVGPTLSAQGYERVVLEDVVPGVD